MPLKLHPPRQGKSPNYSIRGTYHGIGVNRSAGTPSKRDAQKILARIQEDIKRGAFTPAGSLTFAGAVKSYVRAGNTMLYLEPLTIHFGMVAASRIDQAAIDEAAAVLYPNASAATRNRQVYTPVSAVLKHSGIDFRLKRPKGSNGVVRSNWLWEEEAFRLFDAAGAVDAELRIFLMFLCYTGLRLSEALRIRTDQVRLSEAFAFVPTTKNGEPRPVYLPPVLVAELANHPRGMERQREPVFKFKKGSGFYKPFNKARLAAGLPDEVTAHTFRHTWATWMRRDAKLDTKGLVSTGAWADEKSAARYQHVVVSEEARRADLLPTPKRAKAVEK